MKRLPLMILAIFSLSLAATCADAAVVQACETTQVQQVQVWVPGHWAVVEGQQVWVTGYYRVEAAPVVYRQPVVYEPAPVVYEPACEPAPVYETQRHTSVTVVVGGGHRDRWDDDRGRWNDDRGDRGHDFDHHERHSNVVIAPVPVPLPSLHGHLPPLPRLPDPIGLFRHLFR